MITEKSKGNYKTEEMQLMASVASTADGLNIEGNNFKVCALTGFPDMLLFACERMKELEQDLFYIQMVVSEIQELSGSVSCFVENLPVETSGYNEALNALLEIGNKVQDLGLPEFSK